ncbi:cysteine-rich CWC family protein [Xylophilus sp. GOD-11R]|uniref:cysteine-rich CWC family protein n=1 Tax=Xylophilus sp. GOD-11R TaxID=3089814 RepID=UPI00298C3CA0|nr:cysteine-rich CWC family protein [Xylophilus sp. GOD-11R]WPB57229.1 cysteine-rich CWC family protein [Xylophilus sp. GOD-11R]
MPESPLADDAPLGDKAAVCPLCGRLNGCAQPGANPAACASRLDCWCRTSRIAPAVLARIPAAERGLACICKACAASVS